jgi:DNA-binding XRE family transcriptional regulator
MIKVKPELNHIRIKSGFTVTGLANATGVSQQFISAIIKGRYHPSAITAKKICDALGVEFDQVFEIAEG